MTNNGQAEPSGSQANAIKAFVFLEKHIIKYEDGMCEYSDRSLNDTRVAQQLEVSPSTVSRIRKDHIGDLKYAKKAAEGRATTLQRIETLEAEVGALKRLVTDLVKKDKGELNV